MVHDDNDNSDENDDDDNENNDNTVDDREAEFQAWKRRKEYDPLAAARFHLYLICTIGMAAIRIISIIYYNDDESMLTLE